MNKKLSVALATLLITPFGCYADGEGDTDIEERSFFVDEFLDSLDPEGTVEVVVDGRIEEVSGEEFRKMVDDGVYDLTEAPPSAEGPCVFGTKKGGGREDIVLICCITPSLCVIVKWTVCQGTDHMGCIPKVP